MATKFRSRASAPATLPSVADADRQTLADESKAVPSYWTSPPAARKAAVEDFRSDVKQHYFYGQSRRCCYCSFELQGNHSTFDAEHILDRRTYPEFAFELRNLAASCRPCNGSKSKKNVLVAQHQTGDPLPYTSDQYKIVHPHLDEWGDHLEFDDLDRIAPKKGSGKGKETFDVCEIKYLNCARLSDYFTGAQAGAEHALRGFFRVKQRARRLKFLALLQQLAKQYNLAQASAIVERLQKEELGVHAPW